MNKITIIAITDPCGNEIPCSIEVNRWGRASQNFLWNELADRRELTLKYCPELLSVAQWVRTNKNWIVDTTEDLTWYRSKETNKIVRGDPESKHLLGLAFDTKCWYDKVGGRQVNPVHVAYAFQEAFRILNVKGGIGTYYKGYDGSNTNGYNHIDLRTYNHLYVCPKIGKIVEIKRLDELFIW